MKAIVLEVLLAFSHHTIEGDFNEAHPALRYEHQITENGSIASSIYLNSEDNWSVFVGYKHKWGDNLFAEGGLVTGYDYSDTLPMVRAGYENDRTRFWVAPTMTPDGDLGVVLGVDVIAIRF